MLTDTGSALSAATRILSVEEKWHLLFRKAEGPPMYRPEEYIFHLRKWFADSGLTTTDRGERKSSSGPEVSIVLTELLDISELLRNLKFDLKLAHAGFVSEFIRSPNHGVALLLDFLKSSQLAGAGAGGAEENNNNPPPPLSNAHTGSVRNKSPQQVKKMLADEYECLLSLKHATRYAETMKQMMEHPSGIFLAAACAHSNFMKSRVVALELLIKVCECGPEGHNQVQKAMSTLRLRFGEPVRFKFLTGMLNSPGNKSLTFQAYCLSFLNKLLETCPSICKRVYLQCEMDEAGLDMKLLQKFTDYRDFADHKAYVDSFKAWKRNYVDVESLVMVSRRLTADNKQLKNEVEKLRESTKKLEEDKMSLMNSERQLSEQCAELELKVSSLSKTPETSQGESCGESKQGSSSLEEEEEDPRGSMGSPKTTSSSEGESVSPPPPLRPPAKGSDAMSISSEDSHKHAPPTPTGGGRVTGGGPGAEEEEQEVIVPHIKRRSPSLFVWPNRNAPHAGPTAAMSDEDFIRHHLMQDKAALRMRLSVDNADDFALNWSYPAVPLPIAVVTSGKSSLQDMNTSSSSSASNQLTGRDQLLFNNQYHQHQQLQQQRAAMRNAQLSENSNYHSERMSADFHKTLFQRSYPVPSSERLTRTFHV